MPRVARVGDRGQGQCSEHGSVTVTFTEGCDNVSADGIKILTIGHKGRASCGHGTTATTGSSNVKAEGRGVHRVGDSGTIDGGGTYVVTTGSPSMDAN